MSKPNILLLNDTTTSRHAGSIATVEGVCHMLKAFDTPNIYTLPVGYCYGLLAESRGDLNLKPNPLNDIKSSLYQIKTSLSSIKKSVFKTSPPTIELINAPNKKQFKIDAWHSTIHKLKNEPYLNNLFTWCDLVVINGEGTIHHNYYGAQILLALAFVAREQYNKPTLLVNSTIESIDNYLISESLSKINYISVRDNQSREYLENFSINCHMHPDAAFSNDYIDFSSRESSVRNKTPSCLISSGIEQTADFASNLIKIAQNKGYKPTYYCFDNTDNNAYRYCRTNNIDVVNHATIPWQCFPSFLNQFDLCISGRHHLNVFSILGRVPFIPLNSTSWKIQGTLDLISYPLRIAKKGDDIEDAIQELTVLSEPFNNNLIEETISKSKTMISDYFKSGFT